MDFKTFHFGVFEMGWSILIFQPHSILIQFVELTQTLSGLVFGTLNYTLLAWHTASSSGLWFEHRDWLGAGLRLPQCHCKSPGIQCSCDHFVKGYSQIHHLGTTDVPFGCRARPIHSGETDLCVMILTRY